MGKPWEQYQSAQPVAASGPKPWEKYGGAADPAQPGAQAIGTVNGPTPAAQPEKDWVDRAGEIPGALNELARRSHIPGVSLIPAASDAIGALAKRVGAPAQVLAAKAAGIVKPGPNPVSLMNDLPGAVISGDAPGIGDYAVDKFGVPNPSIDIPGTNDKKLTARGIMNVLGNTAVNPLTWGAHKIVGENMYGSALNPVEVEGQRLDKGSMLKVLNKNRIMTEGDLRAKGQRIVDLNDKNVITPMEQGATDAAVEADMHQATAPAQAHVDRLMEHAKPGSAQEKMAKDMQAEIDLHKNMQGTTAKVHTEFQPKPEEPFLETPTESTGRLEQNQVDHRLDANGKPVVNSRVLTKWPGEPVANNGQVPGPLVPGTKAPFVPPDETLSTIEQLKRSDLDKVIGRIRGMPDIAPPARTSFVPEAPLAEPTTSPGVVKRAIEGSRPSPQNNFGTQEANWEIPKTGQTTPDKPGSLPQGGDYNLVRTEGKQGPSANATSQWKTDAYNEAGAKAYDPSAHASSWQNFYKKLGFGMKEATEKAIEKVYGSEGLAKYQQANAESGAILSTGKVQGRVAAQRARDLDVATSVVPSATEALSAVTAGGASKSVEAAGLAGAAIRAWRAAKLAKMPVGYVMQNTPLAPVQGAVLQDNLSNPYAKPGGQ